jgi:hypothetical protein
VAACSAPGRRSNGETRQEKRGRAHPENVVRLDPQVGGVPVQGEEPSLHVLE